MYFIPFIRAPYIFLRNSSERSSLFFLSMSGANNGLPDVMALMLVDGFMKLVLTLGPHPNAPLELYMNKGDRLDDRKWHTVQVIRELKVSKGSERHVDLTRGRRGEGVGGGISSALAF